MGRVLEFSRKEKVKTTENVIFDASMIYDIGWRDDECINVLELKEVLRKVPNDYLVVFDTGDEHCWFDVCKASTHPGDKYSYLLLAVADTARRDVDLKTILKKTVESILEMNKIEGFELSADALKILDMVKDEGIEAQTLKDIIQLKKVAHEKNIELSFESCCDVVTETTAFITPSYEACSRESCPNYASCKRYLLFFYLKYKNMLRGQTFISPKGTLEDLRKCEKLIRIEEMS